ncbi:Glucose-6-phosphate isomerase 1, chloroplastic [Dendrobium catenatum]|uniref:Glucose-6-phosphate isomerase 1, chloroplastic n=1 Tax=Dendrobium catenatum TaxID=906689 RepID=A0A2I0WH79_9ASPA|nr:Glucose-6-phosphate isomerase 1, chloroplastic [Dendrobium catenatum]
MASISGMYSPSSAVKIGRSPITILLSRRDAFFVPISPAGRSVRLAQSVARDIPSGFSAVSNSPASKTAAVEKDQVSLWHRYVDWLYQHKELGLYLDVSRIGFTSEFLERMEPRMQSAFVAMQELEKGAIANPDEGRMVGHYWLRNVALAPNSFLRSQIEKTLNAVSEFADKVISAQIKPPSSSHGRFTQILSVGIGGSALGPQFVAEALAPDNPHLKIRFVDNTDPAGIDHQIAQLGTELASTLVIVISKSGGTPETRNGLLEVQKAFRDAGLEFPKQVVASDLELRRFETFVPIFAPLLQLLAKETLSRLHMHCFSLACFGLDCFSVDYFGLASC